MCSGKRLRNKGVLRLRSSKRGTRFAQDDTGEFSLLLGGPVLLGGPRPLGHSGNDLSRQDGLRLGTLGMIPGEDSSIPPFRPLRGRKDGAPMGRQTPPARRWPSGAPKRNPVGGFIPFFCKLKTPERPRVPYERPALAKNGLERGTLIF